MLKPYVPNNDDRFPGRDALFLYDQDLADNDEVRVLEIARHKWEGNRLRFLITFEDGDQEWKSLAQCEPLAALDEYLRLRGVKSPLQLPRR